MNYDTVIGLEIHAELLTTTKAFCNCPNTFINKPNTAVCPQCMGLPGALPTLNKKAVELAVKAGLAFDCNIQRHSAFDRKNYFYPDLPKAYQITQFFHPIALGGKIDTLYEKINLERIHLEEDAGKLIHTGNVSLANYNRCGIPLIEIVTAPEIHSSVVARRVVEQVALTLKYIGVCSGKMEEGALRCDVNISLKKSGDTLLGQRTEIKNLNSFRAVQHAIEAEEKRQISILEKGEKIKRQTLHFDSEKNTLTVLRTKEETVDYRYFPEPDLPNILLSDKDIAKISETLPETPDKKLKHYINDLKINIEDAKLLVSDLKKAEFFENAAMKTENTKTLISLINVELPAIKKKYKNTKNNLTPINTAALCNMVLEGFISASSAKEIFRIMYISGDLPLKIANKNNMLIKNDTERINREIEKILNENLSVINQYNSGNKKVFGFLMGKVLKNLGGSAQPSVVKRQLETALNNLKLQ